MGEPACSGGRYASDPGHRHGRTRDRAARPGTHRIRLGADRAYNLTGFVADLRQRDAARGATPPIDDRRSMGGRPVNRLRGQWAGAQAHRESVCLDQGDRRLSQDPSTWPRPHPLDAHTNGHCLQPRPAAQADGGSRVAVPGFCPQVTFTPHNHYPNASS